MNDSIYIADIEVSTHIGVPDEERKTLQKIYISVELFLDTREAGSDDDVSKSIDYEAVTNDVVELAKTERKTLEAFAENIAEMIVRKYNPNGVKIAIRKDILPNTRGVYVTIFRP